MDILLTTMKNQFTMHHLLTEFGGLFQKYCHKDASALQQGFQDMDPADLTAYIKDLFHQCLIANEGLVKAEVLEKNQQVYLAMARYASNYHQENPNPYIRMAFEAEFQYYRLQEVKGKRPFEAEIIAEADSCSFGQRLHGLSQNVRDMQRNHPLAGEQCQREEGCVCAYKFHALEEALSKKK